MRPNKPYSIVLGTKWKSGEAVTLPLAQLTHGHLMGTTGYGKSSFLESICVQLIAQGVGVSLIDVGGDLSYNIMRRLVATGFYEKYPDAFTRFIYLDVPRANAGECFLPFNILSGDYDPYTSANLVLEAFKRVWVALQDGTSTNIELLVKMVSFVAAYHHLPLMPYLQYILTRPSFRQEILALIADSYIRNGFADLGIIGKDGRIADIAQTTIKRSYLLSFAPVVRYALAQQENILNFGDLLRDNRSVALNLHIADPDSKRLLGCLFTVQAEEVAKAWDTRTKRGMPYVLMIDEMQNFVAQSGQAFESMFAESRRAGVFIFVAHQYWAQIPLELRGALSQCGITGTFQVGHDDALVNTGHLKFPILERWKKPAGFDPTAPMNGRAQYYTENEQRDLYVQMIEHLPKREAFIRLPGGGFYRIHTLEVPRQADEKRVKEVEEEYLRLYFRPKAAIDREIEATLARFGASQANPSGERQPKAAPPPQQPSHSAPSRIKPPVTPPPRETIHTPEESQAVPEETRAEQPPKQDDNRPPPVVAEEPKKKRPEDEYDLF